MYMTFTAALANQHVSSELLPLPSLYERVKGKVQLYPMSNVKGLRRTELAILGEIRHPLSWMCLALVYQYKYRHVR